MPPAFRARNLRQHVAPLLELAPAALSASRITYALRRLRLHGLIERRPKHHDYRVTEPGLRSPLVSNEEGTRMIRIDASELDELVLHVPAQRVYKVLLSPALQPELRGLSMGMTIYPPGSSNALHNHSESQEVWYVVHGEGEMRVGDERFALKPDTVVVVPPGPYHQITNTGERELKVLWMFTPPGPEQDFIPHKESG